jgi:hypothetical protein
MHVYKRHIDFYHDFHSVNEPTCSEVQLTKASALRYHVIKSFIFSLFFGKCTKKVCSSLSIDG